MIQTDDAPLTTTDPSRTGDPRRKSPVLIIRLDLFVSNAFLVRSGESFALIDTGADFAFGRLRSLLERHGVTKDNLEHVILTHSHSDHAGNARRLQRSWGAQVIAHDFEISSLRRGRSEFDRPLGTMAHLLKGFMPRTFPGFRPDVTLFEDRTITLGRDNYPLRIFHTPGHTKGHLCVELADGTVFVGDLLRGGYARHDTVDLPYFIQDELQLAKSIERVRRKRPTLLHLGHGHEVTGSAFQHAVMTGKLKR
ncbi:putative metallo-hydrolase YflN [Roseivivax jejudonensis]|uniref:Putative metallo-hydrolase YflN n=1 Tax=Roseivivax jejudonensis TaxID=1529041 RepID=A0A1X7A8B4_9RHOB|nr:MBL fold metallo-hydrolase [Roseivivax jejudonensis]SLN71407.1 putative metallo-hydrolase YflN [Roseivivax jejudonensis]